MQALAGRTMALPLRQSSQTSRPRHAHLECAGILIRGGIQRAAGRSLQERIGRADGALRRRHADNAGVAAPSPSPNLRCIG